MLGLKCIQNISIMAEPHNSLHSTGKKDILSAALGQSGLLFAERVDDDVQDVFAALAEDANYPIENKGQNLKLDPTTGKFKANESYENDLDDLMDLISNDTGPFVQSKQGSTWPSADFAYSPQIGSSPQQQRAVQSTSSNLILDSILNDLKCDVAPQTNTNRSLVLNSNALKTESNSVFSLAHNNDFETGKMPGLKALIDEQRYGVF